MREVLSGRNEFCSSPGKVSKGESPRGGYGSHTRAEKRCLCKLKEKKVLERRGGRSGKGGNRKLKRGGRTRLRKRPRRSVTEVFAQVRERELSLPARERRRMKRERKDSGEKSPRGRKKGR